MLGRKRLNPITETLAARVRRISEAPPSFASKPPSTGTKRALRVPSYRPATLAFIGGEKVDAVVTNLSGTGARVQFKRGTPLPERVRVVEPRSGLDRWAYVTWQVRSVAGLQFVGAKAELDRA